MHSELAIWWTTDEDCRSIGEPVAAVDYERLPAEDARRFVSLKDLRLPTYVKDQYMERFGASGRGRLWVPRGINLAEIEWDESKKITDRLSQCAGIVFRREDLKRLRAFPGVITDTELNVI